MILSGLLQVSEYLEKPEKVKLKKWSRKSGKCTNFVIYHRKVREIFPALYFDVKFPKMN